MGFDLVVLGAGAAGMMCAIEAGRRGRRVALLEHGVQVGRKILISGGGRCNFTNVGTQAENFLSENPHFAKSALAGFGPEEMVALVERHRIKYHEKTLGQLFCDGSAREIVTMLERECVEAGVTTVLGARVDAVWKEDDFAVETSRGSFRGASVVPKLGATGFGYDLARQFGLRVVECRPGLVPLIFAAEDAERWCDLTGLAVEVTASVGKGKRRASFREKMLVTHRGLSGPAVLQVSSYWRTGEPVTVDLAPGRVVTAPLLEAKARRDAAAAAEALRTVFPARLAARWLEVHPPEGWSNQALAAMERGLHGWEVWPEETEGYAKAEVTAGGVDTAELDARTMESRRVPGLYFIGEVVDVTGWLGGYNFQWAWASGVCAGRAV
jgi:predicted Rossmann fold flavoprotein